MTNSIFLKLNPYWRNIISPTIVATLILLVTTFVFGLENSMIAPFATISYIRMINMKYHYECLIKHFIRYGLTAVVAHFAVMDLPLCIVLNALALFIVTFYVVDEYNPVNHLPIGMALIFFQMAPTTSAKSLGIRMLALAASFIIILVFVLMITIRDRKKDRFSALLDEGFSVAEELIDISALGDEKKIKEYHLKLRDINRNLSDEIYACNRAAIKKKGKISFYCRFVILFQVINYLTRNYKVPGNLDKAREMLFDYKKLLDEYKPEADYWMLNLRSDRLNVKDFQFRYAMRMVIAMTPCMVFAYLTDIPNAYWLAFSLFYMITPSSDDTMRSVYQRVAGTLIGILISLGLFAIFPGLIPRLVITVILNVFIYSTKKHIFSVIYITCATLAMQTYDLSNGGSMLRCVIFTLIGAAIALLVNRFVLQVHTEVQIELIIGYLGRIRRTMKKLVDPMGINDIQAEEIQKEYLLSSDWRQDEIQCRHLTDVMCIRSYLLTRRLQELDESRPEEMRRKDLFILEKKHMNSMAERLADLLAKPGENQAG